MFIGLDAALVARVILCGAYWIELSAAAVAIQRVTPFEI